jgi:hypothetical protein
MVFVSIYAVKLAKGYSQSKSLVLNGGMRVVNRKTWLKVIETAFAPGTSSQKKAILNHSGNGCNRYFPAVYTIALAHLLTRQERKIFQLFNKYYIKA